MSNKLSLSLVSSTGSALSSPGAKAPGGLFSDSSQTKTNDSLFPSSSYSLVEGKSSFSSNTPITGNSVRAVYNPGVIRSLNITTNEFNKSYNNLLNTTRLNRKALEDGLMQRDESEKKLVESFSPCVAYASPEKDQAERPTFASETEVKIIPGVAKSIQANLSGLDPLSLKAVISNNFYNPEAMRALSCITDTIFYNIPELPGSRVHHARIRQYFQQLRQMGNESAEGYAMTGSFGNTKMVGLIQRRNDLMLDTKGLYVAKVPRDPNGPSLYHEMIIGAFGTNKLRSKIPNFAYILGGVKCSPPWIKQNKDVATWCTHNSNGRNDATYLFYENVTPATGFGDSLKTMAPKDFVNYYMQILLALRLARKEINLTHYDLHTDNVLLRSPPEGVKVSIAYETPGGNTEYMITDKIATIIDYGLSHITYKDRHYGIYDRLAYSIFPDRPWILHDAYKLLLFSAMIAQGNNAGIYNEINKIFQYFNNTERLDDVIKAQFEQRYSLPYINDGVRDSDIQRLDQLITHVRQVCDCSFLTTNQQLPAGVISTNPAIGGMSLGDITQAVGLSKPNLKNVNELYDYMSGTGNANLLIDYTLIAKNTDIEVDTLYSEYNQIVGDILGFDLSDPRNVLTYDFMIRYRTILDNVASIKDKRALAAMLDDTIGKVLDPTTTGATRVNIPLVVKEQLLAVTPDLKNLIRDAGTRLDHWKLNFAIEDKVLDGIVNSAEYAQAVVQDNRLAWYAEGRVSFKFL